MGISQSSAQLLIAGNIRGTSALQEVTTRIGIASLAISTYSILDAPTVYTLSGHTVEKPSRFNGDLHVMHSFIDLFARQNSNQTSKQSFIKQLSVNPTGTRFSLLLFSGEVYTCETGTHKLLSCYPPADTSSVSDVSSLEGLSVIHPVSLTTVCWCGWWDDQTVCVSTYQGDVGILNDEEGDWMIFNPGVLLECGNIESSRFLLVIDSLRRWMKDYEKDVLVSDISCQVIRQVSAIEKYHHCIENKEYGVATSIAKRYGFDLDEM